MLQLHLASPAPAVLVASPIIRKFCWLMLLSPSPTFAWHKVNPLSSSVRLFFLTPKVSDNKPGVVDEGGEPPKQFGYIPSIIWKFCWLLKNWTKFIKKLVNFSQFLGDNRAASYSGFKKGCPVQWCCFF